MFLSNAEWYPTVLNAEVKLVLNEERKSSSS